MAVVQTGTTLTFPNLGGANTGTVSTTISVPADAEFVVVGWSGFSSTSHFFSSGSMTFTKGGIDTAMTSATGLSDVGSPWGCAMFYLALPDTGSNKTLKWDWSGAGAASDTSSLCSVTFWKGIDTASPVRGASGGQSGTSTPYTTGTVTALTGDLLLAWVGAFGEGSVDSWSNLTLIANLTNTGGIPADGAWASGSPTGDTTCAASTDTALDDGSIAAISIKAASAPGAPAVTFIGAGALADNATINSQVIATHANTAIGDILLCQLINKSVTANAFSPPDGTWTAVIATEVNDCTTAADDHQFGLYWKRATAAGAQNFTFTKATDDNVEFAGVISSWRGAAAVGTPLDATPAARTKTAGAADNVTFPAYDPVNTSVHVIFMAYYGNDLTAFAAAMSADTNPDCTLRYDLESATGTDCTLACISGDNDGTNVASRTWASSSTTDAGSTGVVFALVAQAATGLLPKPLSLNQAVERAALW